MSDKPISPLRQRMLDDMNMRRFVPDTQREYIRAVKRLAAFLGRSPDTATAEELRVFQHYGLFASANRAETIVRARELLGLATPAAEEAAEIDPAAAQPLAQPCPCCGGRMFVIETFEAGSQPRYRPTARLVAIRIDTS